MLHALCQTNKVKTENHNSISGKGRISTGIINIPDSVIST